jgi:N-acetylmuramoyl-L-alanine amidase
LFLDLEAKNKKIFHFIVFLSFICASAFSSASASVQVKDIRYMSSPDYTRVVIDLTGAVEFSKNRLSNPDRVYFDLKNASIAKEIKTSLPVGDGIVKTVRASQFKGDTVRIVFDIEEISDFKSFVIDDPARLVIDLYGKSQKGEKPDTVSAKRKIVIDAGHGGHDPGAVGPRKLYEKDVVLDIALKVKKLLTADPLNEVFLTRDKDVFIPLEERTAIANRKNADLFVSIHANASQNRQARGIETYLLNWTDDEEAMKVAARENKISLKKMRAMNKQMDTVETILSGLMRENKRDESIKLANYIQRSMVSNLDNTYQNISDHGVKQALFYVLFGAKMPSILVEVSFISNPEEENRLSQDSYRQEIAKSIASGLNTYVTSAPIIQKVAEFNSMSRSR